MADSFQPWITQYLIGVAETHGANLTAIPYFTKKKKVQLVEFITYDLTSQDDCIWAKISDKQCKIPVRLTKEAMSRYNSFNSRRLTEHKTALISITDFQPFFARIPLGNRKGISNIQSLALNIKSFMIIGSSGEAEWGRPQDVEMNIELMEWCEGLRKDGGDGNILMNRRKEREKAIGANDLSIKPPQTVPSKGPQVASKRVRKEPKASRKVEGPGVSANKVAPADLLKEYERSWRPISLNTWTYALKPPQVEEQLQSISGQEINPDKAPSPVRPQSNERHRVPRRHALDLTSEPGTPPPDHRPSPKPMLPTTPSDWSPSVRGSQVALDEAASDHELQPKSSRGLSPEVEEQSVSAFPDDSVLPNTFTTAFSSYPNPPTPAQRPKPYVSPPTSSPRPALSGPPTNPNAESLSVPTQSSPVYTRRKVMRKVPHPAQPPPKPSMSAPAHILVPNSDTSGTASQPQSQPQPILSSQVPILPSTQEEQGSFGDDGFHSLFGVTQPDISDCSPKQSDAVPDARPGVPSHSRDELDEDGLTNVPPVAKSQSQRSTAPDSDTEDESKDKYEIEPDEDEVDELQEDEPPSWTSELRSIVPDSQEDLLDEEDAQIDKMLFGSYEEPQDDEGSLKDGPDSATRGSVEKDQIIDLVHHPADDSKKTPKVSRQLHRPYSKELLELPVQNTPPPDIHPVEHNKEAWSAPSFMHDRRKDKAPSKITDRRKGSLPLTPPELSNSLLSGIDGGKITVAPSGKPTSDSRSTHIPISAQHFPEIQGKHKSNTTPDPHAQPPVTSRMSPKSAQNGTRSHKRPRETPTEDQIEMEKEGSKRRRLDIAPSNGASSSKKTLDHVETRGNVQVGDIGKLRQSRKDGDIKDDLFSRPVGSKLNGFKVSFDEILSDDEKGWSFGWGDLQQILLQTGRKRYKEQNQKT